uniref:Uncharacterized protein n=1 Tax=Anguilla anguilla TaxID=7936 RepID=A0A0E9SHG5_ANGAN
MKVFNIKSAVSSGIVIQNSLKKKDVEMYHFVILTMIYFPQVSSLVSCNTGD